MWGGNTCMLLHTFDQTYIASTSIFRFVNWLWNDVVMRCIDEIPVAVIDIYGTTREHRLYRGCPWYPARNVAAKRCFTLTNPAACCAGWNSVFVLRILIYKTCRWYATCLPTSGSVDIACSRWGKSGTGSSTSHGCVKCRTRRAWLHADDSSKSPGIIEGDNIACAYYGRQQRCQRHHRHSMVLVVAE